MEKAINIGGKEFLNQGHTYVMGILNVSPDSFSDGGCYTDRDSARRHIEQMLKEGADIIDIGGESTRPGYRKVSMDEEIERLAGMIGMIKAEYDVPLSVDTYKSPVAYAALEAGADMVNDIWGLRYETEAMECGEEEKIKERGTMAEVVKKFGVPVCIMHNRKKASYDSFYSDILADLQESLKHAEDAGIDRKKIIIDPGIGFAKNYEMNLMLIKNVDILKVFDLPILMGASRKSVIGLTLNLPVEEREEGTLVTTVFAVERGCQFVRVHDVGKSVRAIKMAEAIIKI